MSENLKKLNHLTVTGWKREEFIIFRSRATTWRRRPTTGARARCTTRRRGGTWSCSESASSIRCPLTRVTLLVSGIEQSSMKVFFYDLKVTQWPKSDSSNPKWTKVNQKWFKCLLNKMPVNQGDAAGEQGSGIEDAFLWLKLTQVTSG